MAKNNDGMEMILKVEMSSSGDDLVAKVFFPSTKAPAWTFSNDGKRDMYAGDPDGVSNFLRMVADEIEKRQLASAEKCFAEMSARDRRKNN